MQFDQSIKLQKKIHSIIPGGSHTYAKGDDQYPEFMPPYIVKGQGCHVWDADENEFIEYGMGLRSVTLGHAYPPVVEAAYKQMQLGNNFVRPATIELECAEKLLSLIAGAEMVKFGKNGSDANSAAIKVARAYTGRDMIAICGSQPFFAVDDWFIGTTSMNAGIPKAIRTLTVKFQYNDIESFKKLLQQYPGKIACAILEAEKEQAPAKNYLHELQNLCRDHGIVFILDEMITGFRWHLNGAQRYYNIVPDLSTFGKGMGNGFSISALVGKKDILRLGGLDHEKERVFLISTTHGAEGHSLAAVIETINIYQRNQVVEFLWQQGARLAGGMNRSIQAHNLTDYVSVRGKPCCLVFGTRDHDKKPSQPFRTLFIQEMMKRGILAPSFAVSYSHSDADIDRTVEAIDETLQIYRKALDEGIDKYLVGRPVKPVFRRFN